MCPQSKTRVLPVNLVDELLDTPAERVFDTGRFVPVEHLMDHPHTVWERPETVPALQHEPESGIDVRTQGANRGCETTEPLRRD